MARYLTHSGCEKTKASSHLQSIDRRVHGCKISDTRQIPTGDKKLQREQQAAITRLVEVPAMQVRIASMINLKVVSKPWHAGATRFEG